MKYVFLMLCGLVMSRMGVAATEVKWSAEEVLGDTSSVEVGTSADIVISLKDIVRLGMLGEEETADVSSMQVRFGYMQDVREPMFVLGDVVATAEAGQDLSFAWKPEKSGYYRLVVQLDGHGEICGQLIRAYRIWHVDANKGDDANTGKDVESSLKSIQMAIDVSSTCDEILVNDGRYAPFVVTNKAIVIRSVNGAEKTVVDGGGTNRCVACVNMLHENPSAPTVEVRGFCLRNGVATNADELIFIDYPHTRFTPQHGGGALGGVLVDCVVENCHAVYGGGVCDAVVESCVVSNCVADYVGGGGCDARFVNSLIVYNEARNDGGGCASSVVCNSTVTENHIPGYDFLEWYGYIGTMGGMPGSGYNSTVINSIVWNNYFLVEPDSDVGHFSGRCNEQDDIADKYMPMNCTLSYSCIPYYGQTGEVISVQMKDPGFRDAERGDFRLEAWSPCIDAGSDSFVEVTADVEGLRRVVGKHVDMGAYEFQNDREIETSIVTFDLAGLATRIGGGEVVQAVTNGFRAEYPLLHVAEDHIFSGWDKALTKVRSNEVYTAIFAKVNGGTIQLDPIIDSSLTLDPDKVYVVKGTVFVGEAAHVVIPPGTVVKFFDSAVLDVSADAFCVADGAVFTHVADDTIGGDTLLDADATHPVHDSFAVYGVDLENVECRYLTPRAVTLSGTIANNERWGGHAVYRVGGNLTIPRGVTLTIEPGAVVKFDTGVSLTVAHGGVLDARGTRGQPIVFTSLKDDEYGGDTNGDGDATKAQAGDWARIYAYGAVNMSFCRVANCNNTGDQGAIQGYGGTVTLNNCLLERSVYELVRMNSGSFSAYNCIFRDASMAFGWYGGSGTRCYNCVIADVSEGVRASGKYFYNCIFYRVLNFGSTSTYRNCCFYNPPDYANSAQSFSVVGRDGNFWADPQFENPNADDYRLRVGSPCIDAGNGSYAPATDYFGQTRQTVDAATAKGSKAANGNYPDIGIYEYQPREVAADVDLTVTAVTAPVEMTVGEKVAVSWTVKNVGTAYATGSWRDKAEIVCANGTAVALGEKTVTATLAPGAEQTFTAMWTVPSAQAGTVHVRVTANAERDIFEGTLVANNMLMSETATEMALPVCAIPSDGHAGRVTVPAGDGVSYKLGADFAAGGLLVVKSTGKVAVRTGNGQLPTADTYHGTAVQIADGEWLVSVPEGGEAYVSIENEGDVTADVDVAYQKGAFVLYDTGASVTYTIGYGNDLVLTVYGNGFASGGGRGYPPSEASSEGGAMRGATALPGTMAVALVGAGEVVEAAEITVSAGGTKAVVTFAEADCLAGSYHLRLSRDGETLVQAGNPITIQNRATGGLPILAEMEYSLEMTSTVRQGREYMGYIVYGNKGKGVGAAPYLRVTASNGSYVRFSQSDAWSSQLELMGISQSYPASQVKAGESVKVPFYYKTSNTSADIRLGVASSADGDFPWETNGRYMRPSWASDEFWGLAFAILKANVGTSWGDWIDRMRHNADYLMKLGKPTYRLEPLWQLEVNEALGVDHAVSSLAGGTDLARSGRGLGLALRRSYGAAFYSRFKSGVFGYGWSDNYSAWAELQDSGSTLALHSGGGSTYRFYKTNGAWAPEDARDKTKVGETASEYVLTYRSGTVQRIAKSNMRVKSITDNQGNAIVFTYAVGGGGGHGVTALPVRVAHTDGQTLDFAYEGGKLVSVTDDQGRVVRYAYDGDLLASVTAFNGLVTRYAYYPADGTPTSRALRQIVYPDGNTKDFTYDAAGRVATAAVNGNQMLTEIVRGEFGSYKTIAPNGGVSSVSVGVSGEVLETVNALGQKVTRTYTEDTLLESLVGPTGKRSKIAYDADGNAVKATDAAGAQTSFAYTSDYGALAKVTDARGNSFNYAYDKLGRSEQISYADNSLERIQYSDRGDITNSVNRRGQSVAYTYDKEGNVLSETWETGRTLTWQYDDRGNCTNACDSETGAVTMEYDANERLTRIAYPNGHGFTYAYDALGRTTSRTSFDGFAQKYEYDALGRLKKLTDGDGKAYLENVYDETTGQLWLMKYGNGTIVSNAYDILGRTTGIYHYTLDDDGGRGATALPSSTSVGTSDLVGGARRAPRLAAFFEYAYDAEGRRISQTTTEGVERYTYDTVGQLTDVTYPDGTEEHFRYDAVGNRLTANGDTYEVNNLNQYTSVGGDHRAPRTTYTYDADGNMTSKTHPTDGTTTYTYDLQSRLVAVTNETKDICWACVYDVFGNRVKVIDHDAVTEKVFVQGSLPSVAEEYANGTRTKRHIMSGALRLADISGEAASSPLDQNDIHYYHTDGLSSMRIMTDATGASTCTASYKAFGEERVGSRVPRDRAGWVGTLGVDYDAATGLYFMRNRYYDADCGRFVQEDPVGLAAGDVNCYRYCHNIPMQNVDPSGLWDISGGFGCVSFVVGRNPDTGDWVARVGPGVGWKFGASWSPWSRPSDSVVDVSATFVLGVGSSVSRKVTPDDVKWEVDCPRFGLEVGASLTFKPRRLESKEQKMEREMRQREYEFYTDLHKHPEKYYGEQYYKK